MSPRRDGGPNRSPQLTVAAVIFGGVGVVALIVAVVATQAAVAVFGVFALVIAGVVYAAQRVRERSAVETEQTLGVGPILSPAERSGYDGPEPDMGAAPLDEEPEPEEPSDSGATEHAPSVQPSPGVGGEGADGAEDSELSISEEDDGTGARPGDQAASNVGAATATDLDADPETGRPLHESATTDPDDDDGSAPSGGRVEMTVRRSSDDGGAESTEHGAQARSGDG